MNSTQAWNFYIFSTVSEAIRCSKLMKAEHTILTHISSRHLFPCQSSRLPDRVSFAFDHMTVCRTTSIISLIGSPVRQSIISDGEYKQRRHIV